ncbi:hypothetical protein BKA70DRAFT_1287873 [Coprinopsis sp. MPI-PUGE-AT-0042]|nr:hypothetical protein BKA70DRAFT_1287873 [Coprinopsis sp. MPI-PUGE-AT-0042]
MPLFSPEEEVVIEAACREHEETHFRSRGETAFILVGPYAVKYGDPMTLASYIQTRSYLYNAQQQTNKPRIHQLVHHFDNGQGTAFVVLEAIKLAESPPDLDERIRDAITWLSGGPLGGGFIRHRFFKFEEGRAPLPFVDVKALERYLGKGRKRVGGRTRTVVDPVRLMDERLVCVHAGMHNPEHFGVDEAGNAVMMGLGHVSFLPESFARSNLPSSGPLGTLRESLGLSGANNMMPMARIANVLGMTSDVTLGPDKYGRRRKDEVR